MLACELFFHIFCKIKGKRTVYIKGRSKFFFDSTYTLYNVDRYSFYKKMHGIFSFKLIFINQYYDHEFEL